LRASLRIPDKLDARTAIEVELQKLRERLEKGEVEGDDEDVHGGRRNGKNAEEAEAKDVTQSEKTAETAVTAETTEEKNQEASDREGVEEQAEEKASELEEQTPVEEQTPAEEMQELQPVGTEELEYTDRSEPNVENNGLDERSEPSEHKTAEDAAYNDAYNDTADAPPLYEGQSRKASEATSFIDEVIMDNMIKGKEDIIGHNPLQDVAKESEMRGDPGTATSRGEETKGSYVANGKDAFLYDKALMDARTEDVRLSEKAPETKTETVKPTPQNQQTANQNAEVPAVNPTAENVKADFKNLRIPLQMEITLDEENEMRRGINDQMTEEAILEHIRLQTDAWREQISIAELSMDDSVVQVARPVPPKAEPARTISNRK
jgi:hypothetical protein